MIIAHRINRLADLAGLPEGYGVEVDLRHDGASLVLQHDPKRGGERFEKYLRGLGPRFLVVNSKCDGIEEEALRLLARHRVRQFFFVDLAMPAMARLARRGERRIAARFSEFEPPEAVLALEGVAEWLWVDCFTRYPSMGSHRDRLLKNFKICLVAPELHGRASPSRLRARRLASRYGASAVCTDLPVPWEEILGR
jgi:hypothetical protein